MGHIHSHNHSHQHADLKGRNLLISILLNILITIAQAIGGVISGSLSLLSDALHNFSDVLSLMVSYIATILSKKEASGSKTFGYKRAEIVAAFVNSSALLVVAIILIKEAVERFMDPQEIGTDLVIWLSLLGILANGISVLLLKKQAGSNLNMKSAYLHLTNRHDGLCSGIYWGYSYEILRDLLDRPFIDNPYSALFNLYGIRSIESLNPRFNVIYPRHH